MRIRRAASKLLGLAAPPPSSPSSSPPPGTAACSSPHWPPPASAPAAADDVLFCQLNCSPWDVLTNLDLLLQRDEEEDVKLDGSVAMAIQDLVKVDEPSSEGKKKAKQKKTARRKKEAESMHGVKSSRVIVGVVATCKKTDGKSWHCKRPAQPPHTLCHHHLDQLRSYNNSASAAADVAAAGDGSVRCRRKRMDAAATHGGGGVDANAYYYYYSGFGPWRGKTRGSSGGVGGAGGTIAAASEVEEEEEDDADAPVAGGDEESESFEEDGIAHGESGVEGVVMRDDEKRRKFRKRGRKAVKARSLKSLL